MGAGQFRVHQYKAEKINSDRPWQVGTEPKCVIEILHHKQVPNPDDYHRYPISNNAKGIFPISRVVVDI